MNDRGSRIAKRLAVVAVLALGSTVLVSGRAGGGALAGVLGERVVITRDNYGVPHVFGATLEAVWYGVGYAQAQDRLWQAEMLRRTATGTSAEVLGPGAVESDVLTRTLFGPPERRATLRASASPRMKRILESFVAGLNAGIAAATATGTLPPEYAIFGLTPRPWTVDDVIAEGMLVLRTLGEFGGVDELAEAAAFEEWNRRLGPVEAAKQFADTHWANDPSARTSVPSTRAVNPVRPGAPHIVVPAGIREAFNRFRAAHRQWERHIERVGLSHGPKSNAIAIAPRLSADGHALLLGGPQVGYSTPQLGHEVGVHGAGYDVTGMAIAGLPGVAIGVARHHAWTMTSGVSKNNYIYVEQLNAQGQYVFKGRARSLDCREETIQVRGADAVVRQLCESVHGPVVASAPGVVFTLKTAVRGHEVDGMEVFHDMMRATSYNEFKHALSGSVYNLNVVYADAPGNIAYWHVGRIPVPAAGDNIWLPRDGKGGAEWQGFVPFAAMPHAVNPSQGWLATWNNKPSPEWNNSVSSGLGTWGPVQRVNTLMNLLDGLGPRSATLGTLEAFNRIAGATTDTPRAEGTVDRAPAPSAFHVFVSTKPLVAGMLANVEPSADPRLPEALLLLENWDGLQLDENHDGIHDSPSAVLFNTWWRVMTEQIFGDDFGPAFSPDAPTVNESVIANLVYRLVVPDPAVPLLRNYLGSQSVRQAVTGALVAALDRLQARFGSPSPQAWRQPAGQIVWTPLGIGSVPNTPWMNRGTYNQLVHLGRGAKLFAFNVVAPGQSGNPVSPHFADQLELYATWRYKPMRLHIADLLRYTTSTITLQVPR